MGDSSVSLTIENENTYTNNIKKLITQYENDILHKALNSYLTQNYKEAEMLLLTKFPDNYFNKNIMVQYLMGHIKLKLKEYNPSIYYFCQSLNKEINFMPYVYDSKGLAFLLQQKDYNDALRNFKDACIYSQNNFHFHNHLALCYKIIYNLQKEKNKIILDKESNKDSKKESGIFNSGKSLSSSQVANSDNEEEKGRKKVKDKNKLKKMTTIRTQLRIKYRDAFKEVLNINPNSYISLLNLGTYYAEDGEIDQAGKYYKKAEIINKQTTGKKDWKVYINLAFIAFLEKEYPLSMGYFEIVFKSFENKVNLKVLNVYMICLYQNKEWQKLEKTAKKILKIDKRNKKALVYLITSLEKNKKIEDLFFLLKKIKSKMKLIKQKYIKESSRQSKSKSEKELEDLFQSPLSHYKKLKQIIQKKLKKVQEDIIIERQDITKGQNTDSTFEDIGKDNLRSFGFKHDYIDKILVLQNKNKNNIVALFNIGFIYYKEEEFAKSEEYFKKVQEINPEFRKSLINEYLGDIYMNLYNSPKKALKYYNKALSVCFNNSMSDNNASSSNINANNINISSNNELLLVKIGLCYEILEENESALRYYKSALKKNREFVNPIFHIGCIYDKMNKIEEALTYLEIAYEKEKENVDYLQKYGDCLVKSKEKNNILKGITILERGIEFFTGNIDIISSLAKGYEKQGKLKEAITLLEKAKNNQDFFTNKTKIFQLAFYYEKNKELTKAIEYFKKVMFIDKKNLDALLHMGYIYHSIRENVKSFKCFKQVLNLDKNNFLANFGLGRLYQSLDNHDSKAIDHYKNCLSINSESIKANLQLGIIYLKIKNYDESLKCLRKVIELDSSNITGLISLGNVYLEINNYLEAKKYLESALNLDPKNVSANAALGDVYFAMNEISEAIQKYLYTNRLNDNIPEAHLNLAHCFFINERLEPAITHYIKAIKLVKNTRHDYYYFLGNALMANCRFKDGIIAYQAAIKLKPNKLNYYYSIAKACYMEKLNMKGIKYLEKLLRLEKDKTINKNLIEQDKEYKFNDALFLLFKLYVSLPEPDYNKGLTIIKALIRNEPKNINYLNILGSLQEKKGNFSEAIKAYRQVLAVQPNNIEAKKKLDLLDINEENQELVTNKYSNKSNSNTDKSRSSDSNESSYSSDSEDDKSKSKSSSKTNKKEKSGSKIESKSKSKNESKNESNSESKNESKSKSQNKSENKSNEDKSINKNSESKVNSFNISSHKNKQKNNGNNNKSIESNKESNEED